MNYIDALAVITVVAAWQAGKRIPRRALTR
jgi:hypothetical protein